MDLKAMLLGALEAWGLPALALAAFLGALGLPVPVPLLVLTVGALARQGRADVAGAMALCLAGSILGESALYALGRLAGEPLRRRAKGRLAAAWGAAQARFQRSAAGTVWLTRFLLTPLGVPTNLVAGASGYAFGHFLCAALAGDLVWIVACGGLGYACGSVATAAAWLPLWG